MQIEDVLDTWFSSGMWPFIIFNDSDIHKFFPSKKMKIDFSGGDPLYNPNRHTMLMKFTWENEKPKFSYVQN